MRLTVLLFSILFSSVAFSIPSDYGVDYDIVYVRYPGQVSPPIDQTPYVPWPTGPYTSIPQGEKPYEIMPGADLMLLHPNGTEEILVDCTDCSVMDPYISYDGTTVYYSKIVNITTSNASKTAGYLYKMNISGGAPYTEVQLTYPGTFDSLKHAANTTANDSLSSFTEIRDMSPVPLSNGKILFTTNRHANMGFFMDTSPIRSSVQSMYIMDDHDGTANTPDLANFKRIDFSNMSMVQHPMQLKDGRILFSTWQDFGNKFGSSGVDGYAQTALFTMYPDGSNIQQFTEPHDRKKNVEHFITQLDDESIVAGWYYPSFDFGFGGLLRYPIDPPGQNHLRDTIPGKHTWSPTSDVFTKFFMRVGTEYITPHTSQGDIPAPNGSGKYAMPSWGKSGHMLVAYSTGYVNWFSSNCTKYPTLGDPCQDLKSGIYLFLNAKTAKISDPTDTAQLAPMIDVDGYNEIWPRAVVPYNDVFGQSAPTVIPSVREVNNVRIAKGELAGIVGTSSMINREAKTFYGDALNPDGQARPSDTRETNLGNYSIVGTEVGVFNDSEIHAVRIIATPETPFTSFDKPVSVKDFVEGSCNAVECKIAAGFTSGHGEPWKILGEFPFAHKAVTDAQGNPDTSWQAKIPAHTPTFIQAIDVNGMTLYSETTWRALAPGEERTDCGGCHVHSTDVTTLDFATTETGKGTPIADLVNVPNNDPRIQYSMWDLTTPETPMLDENGDVEWLNGKWWGVEYKRDIEPIINNKCVSCHSAGNPSGGLALDSNVFLKLTNKTNLDASYRQNKRAPQLSKYIRIPQARNSLFVWVAWDSRLDGRTNAARNDDIDFPLAHPVLNLPFSERRAIARWVDLGLPMELDGVEPGIGYLDDAQLPIIEIYSPKSGQAPINQKLRFGVWDSQTAVDWATLSITWYDVSTPGTVNTITNYKRDNRGVVIADFPALTQGNDYVFKISVNDTVGNNQVLSSRFTAQAATVRPSKVNNINVAVQ